MIGLINVFIFLGIVYLFFRIVFLMRRSFIEKRCLRKILSDNPNFNVSKFKADSFQCIKNSSILFASGKMNELMRLLSRELYNIRKSEIDYGVSNGYYNAIFFKKIYRLFIVDYRIEKNYYVIVCKAWVSLRNLNVNTKSFEVESYDTGSICPMYFEFIKTINATDSPNLMIKNCPNCGAEVSMNAQGRCVHCNVVLLNDEYSWVLNRTDKLYYTK